MTQKTDKRFANAIIEFKDKPVDSTAINALVECLEMIAYECSDSLTALPPPVNKKGMCSNGNAGKNKK